MKTIGLAYSQVDLAGKNIAERLLEIGLPKKMNIYSFEEKSINLPLNTLSEEEIIVLSKHSAASGKKSLTVHNIGNFSLPEFGGKEKTLVGSLARIQTNLLRGLNQKNVYPDYTVCYEATHHGPFVEKKVCFIELGSSETEWTNKVAARIVAETILEKTFAQNTDKVVIGIGGGHYTPDFTKLALRKNYSFGHICPQYSLDYLDEYLLEQMIIKTGAEEIIIDWKGLKNNKENVVKLCEKSGLVFERVQRLLK
jgi:D-aminoacyl-tRNA deacylase